MRLINKLADQVVRIYVKKVSSQRPQFRCGDMPFLYYDYRGQQVNFSGSGWVRHACGPFKGRCPCCDQDNGQFWKIQICTARHVVFDDEECQSCDVILFDDGVNQPYTLRGGQVFAADTDKDYCFMRFCTHDGDVGRRLEEPWTLSPVCDLLQDMCQVWEDSLDVVASTTFSKMNRMWNNTARESDATMTRAKQMNARMDEIDVRARQIYREARGKFEEIPGNRKQELYQLWEERESVDDEIRNIEELRLTENQTQDELAGVKHRQAEVLKIMDKAVLDSPHFKVPVFVISHPHGKMKLVSVGEYAGYDMNGCFRFTSATCPGSSGGAVVIMGLLFIINYIGKSHRLSQYLLPHQGAVTDMVGSTGTRIDVLTV